MSLTPAPRIRQAETGFLRYTFVSAIGTLPAASQHVERHVHWNVNDWGLVSMHIQHINWANGVEINKWGAFDAVSQAVLAALNSATGGMQPTTNPPGKKLTL